MDTDTARDVQDVVRIARSTDAGDVARATYDRLLGSLEALGEDDWHRPTECARWDVAAMVGHLVGAAKACASVRESVRQQRWGRRHAAEFDGNSLDAMNELQVREHAALSAAERVSELRRVAPAAVTGRLRVPGPIRAIRVPLDAGGSTAPGMPTRFQLADLFDTIYTRDVWLHTVDIARATSRPFEVEPDLDRRIVEDVVAEWAACHRAPFVLTLTGAAGGRFRQGDRGPAISLDAVEFCRVLSGRAEVTDVLDTRELDPAVVALFGTRVLF